MTTSSSFLGQEKSERNPEQMFIDPVVLSSSEIPAGVKHLIEALHHFVDKRGQCFPGLTKIAQYMSRSRRSVSTYIKQAVELRLISVRYRWLTTNEYTLLCLVPPKVINRVETAANKLNPLKNITTFSKTNGREIKVCLEDSKTILGDKVFTKNRNWLYKMIRVSGYEIYQECLNWLRSSMLMAEVDGKPIESPSGLLTWKVRQFVMI